MYMYCSARTLTHARATRSSRTYIPLGYNMLAPRREGTIAIVHRTRVLVPGTAPTTYFLFPTVAIVQPYYRSTTAALPYYSCTQVQQYQYYKSSNLKLRSNQ